MNDYDGPKTFIPPKKTANTIPNELKGTVLLDNKQGEAVINVMQKTIHFQNTVQ